MKERILINIFSHNMGRFFEMFLGLLLVPFLIKVLGFTGFGLIVFAESIIYFFQLSITGLRGALGRYIGICIYQNNKKEANSYIAAAEGILLVIILFSLVVGGLISNYLPVLFNVPVEFEGQAKVLMLLMIFSFIIQIRFTSSWAIIYSHQRFDTLNIYGALRNIIRCILAFMVYAIFDARLYYYGFIYFIAIFVEQILIARGAHKIFPELIVSVRGFTWSKVKTLFSFMGFRTIQHVSGILYAQTDMVLINRFFGPYYNAIYSVSLKFSNVLQRLIHQSLWVLAPSFTELLARKEEERIKHIYGSITKVTALFSLPICILLGFFGKELIFLWVGKEFIEAINPMYIHVLAVSPVLIFATAGSVATAYAKIKVPSLVSLACAIGNVVVSLFCALKLGWGLVGFAFGSLSSHLIYDLIFKAYYTCKIAKIDFRSFYCNSFLKPLVLSGTFGLLVYYLKFTLILPLGYVFGCLALAVPIYCYLSYVLILNSYEKDKIKEIIKIIFDVVSQKQIAIKKLMENKDLDCR